jgi:1-phosphofructokinase family hexose kinase
MILTLTPNPTIDRVVFVRGFRLGAVVRAEREVVTPSGKGVDASLVIHELGGETVALGLNAGLSGRLLVELLDEWRIEHDFVSACGETRSALVLVDLQVGRQSTISAPTLTAGPEQLAALLDRLTRYAADGSGLICGGSLPPGLASDSYAHLLRHARGLGLFTLLDTSGKALRQGIAGLPHVLKVNLEELAILDRGHTYDDCSTGDDPQSQVGLLVAHLAPRLGEWAGDALVITLGGQGCVAVTREGSYYAVPPSVAVANTAGAGDALNGGLMLARSQGQDWPSALALGTAAAASVVMNEGTAICQREQVESLLPRVRVKRAREC